VSRKVFHGRDSERAGMKGRISNVGAFVQMRKPQTPDRWNGESAKTSGLMRAG
jgi:hypothetical protein